MKTLIITVILAQILLICQGCGYIYIQEALNLVFFRLH
jgi:hypothetical protein